MGLFSKKIKDYRQINLKSKSDIISLLQQLQLNTSASTEVRSLLRSIQSQISFQMDCDKEEVEKIDSAIIKLLKNPRD